LSLNLVPFFLINNTALSITFLWINFIALKSFSSECPTKIVSFVIIVSRKG
jgi:hypothetical protein